MEQDLASVQKDLEEKAANDPKTKKKEEKLKENAKKNKYRKDKPWDDGTVDHWKLQPFNKEDNPFADQGFLEESSFATLFPAYREKYLKTIWPDVKECLKEHGIKAELDLTEGSMSVHTTSKCWDPFIL